MVNFIISVFKHICETFFADKVNERLDKNGYYKFKSISEKKRYQEYYNKYSKVSSDFFGLMLLYRAVYACNISINITLGYIIGTFAARGYFLLGMIINIILIVIAFFYIIRPTMFRNKFFKIPLLLVIPGFSLIRFLVESGSDTMADNIYIAISILFVFTISLDILMNSIRKKKMLKIVDPNDELVIFYKDYEI